MHTTEYLNSLKKFASAGGGFIEQDTVLCQHSFEVALMAAGAVCDAVERIDRGESKAAFCLVRPPGHHAATDRAAGFCLLNNVAIAARLAWKEFGYERVLIVDWDVHHGDGTQAIFWTDPRVAYFSMHRQSIYPFTGLRTETGAGIGAGTTKNLPIRFGTSRQDQLKRFENELSMFAETVKPQFVLISAGFDAHKDDPIGSLGLEARDFCWMTEVVLKIANRHANGKIASVLEGGYHPVALADCVEQHLKELTPSHT